MLHSRQLLAVSTHSRQEEPHGRQRLPDRKKAGRQTVHLVGAASQERQLA